MKISYYPGCTLKTAASGLESSAIAVAASLGVEMIELERWNCCGGVYSLAKDDLMHQVAPVRNLVRVQQVGSERMVTLCAMCYNTLKRANLLVKEDEEKRGKINNFMDREEDYRGGVRVLHMLELLRDEIGLQRIAEGVTRSLEGLKVAPYYGCLLLRPAEIGVDDMEEPAVMKDILECAGIEGIDIPYKAECCGSYQTVNQVDVVVERTHRILGSAVKRGADALAVSCPLCFFNLDRRQKELKEVYRGFTGIPIFYFTQLLAIAMGAGAETCDFSLHHIDPRPLLERKGLI